MGSNAGKVAGNSVDVSDYDKTIIAGSSANVNPCTRVNEEYYSKKMYIMTSGGIGEMNVAYPRYENVDSSSAFHGGRLGLIGLNSVEILSGCGGINLESPGNINLQANGGILTLNSTGTVSSTSKQIELNTNNLLAITSPVVYIDSPDTTFVGNVRVGGNTMMRGGLAVGGEFYCAHMTVPAELSATRPNVGSGGKINKMQQFMITATCPELTAAIVSAQGPSVPIFNFIVTSLEGLNPIIPDVHVEPHTHLYEHPSWDAVDGSKDYMTDASKVESSEAIGTKDPSDIIKKRWKRMLDEEKSNLKSWAASMIGIEI